jgi:signal transduction histidine kinase
MRLSRFLRDNSEAILLEWEAFAKTLEPAAAMMTRKDLRDHANKILTAIALDIESTQSDAEQIVKSHGDGHSMFPKNSASVHGFLREASGFSLVQLTAEFRALRASVLRLWLPNVGEFNDEVHEELMRFNEAVDQALAESAITFTEHSNQTRDRFLAILGSDLRAPLSAIHAAGAVLERSKSLDGTAVLGKRVVRGAAAMSTMVNDLLEYSRTQLGGKMPLVAASADVKDVVQAALHEAKSVHPDCQFHCRLQGDTKGTFDAARLQQAVVNLLANAAQYHAVGTIVALDVAGESHDVVIAVTNQGPMIPAESLETIFSAMVHLPADGEVQGRPRTSLGLGLFIAREIALAHGGSIRATSSDADGTRFTMRIARDPEAPAQ